MEARAGMTALPLANEVVGSFDGPPVAGPHNHYIIFNRIVMAEYITLQQKGYPYLQVNGIKIQGEFLLSLYLDCGCPRYV